MAVDGTLRQTLEQLRRQGLAWMRHDLVANGDLIGAGSVCRLLGGISREELDERIERQELLALPPVELESLGRVEGFPRVQFTETGVLPGLAQVLAAMPDEDPWVKFNYLVNPDVRLAGRRPIDLLGQGEIEAVVAAARRVGEFEPDESPFLF
jgi:hypothetical protein